MKEVLPGARLECCWSVVVWPGLVQLSDVASCAGMAALLLDAQSMILAAQLGSHSTRMVEWSSAYFTEATVCISFSFWILMKEGSVGPQLWVEDPALSHATAHQVPLVPPRHAKSTDQAVSKSLRP